MAEQVIPDNVSDEALPAVSPEHHLLREDDAPKTLGAHDNESQAASTPDSSNTADLLQHWIDRALTFFSHASNETLGACFVALGASTYLILGRIGLVLIGVVGGIALHATWEGSLGRSEHDPVVKDTERRRRELGLDVVNRIWYWRENHTGDTDIKEAAGIGQEGDLVGIAKELNYARFDPETAAALNTFTDAVIRDYVYYWYAPVLPGEEAFPSASRQTFMTFVLSLATHCSRKRPVDIFLDFITNSSSIVIVFLNELSAALNASPNAEASVAIDTYLQLKPESSLARMLDPDQQTKKLSMVAEDMLQNYLDAKSYSCPPVHIFLKQILSKLILSMTLDSCSKPEFINGWIVYLLEEGEPELMQAIDAGVERSSGTIAQNGQKQATDSAQESSQKLESPEQTAHKRHVSQAEDAMDDAMQEARRLTQMIIEEEEARKERERQAALSSSEDISGSTTHGVATPTSSQSESEKVEGGLLKATHLDSLPVAGVHEKSDLTTATDTAKQPFTSFDQILPPQLTNAVDEDYTIKPWSKSVLTLVNARMSLFDDSVPGEKGTIRTKPTAEYLIQIEPASSSFSGWMIARKYADFEVLHEVIRRISVITGVRFTEHHGTLPTWKNNTKASLRAELEKYLSDAVQYQSLAESEGMKRFLEKEQGLSKSPSGGKGFGWPDPMAFNTMGKGMMDVLTKAPKGVVGGVAGGGKALFGGVQNVLGGKKSSGESTPQHRPTSSISPAYITDSYMGGLGYERESMDSIRSRPADIPRAVSRTSTDTQSGLRRQPSQGSRPRPSISSRSSTFDRSSLDVSRPSTVDRPSEELSRSPHLRATKPAQPEPSQALEDTFNLPPPPSLIDEVEAKQKGAMAFGRPSQDAESRISATPRETQSGRSSIEIPPQMPPRAPAQAEKSQARVKSKPPISEQETQVTVELLFAVITELYTLSSAWNIRRTLLQAAKTFLLRPGNPQLEAIRVLIQESVIDANASDSGMAALILKTRENSLPTEDELKKWPKPPTDKEKEELRIKARKLLVERGMPQALTSVMGAAASGEALGKVFDCLQVESVARSMMFGLMLQALRAVVQ